MGKLPDPDGGGITISGDPQIDQIPICQIGASGHGRHASMNTVETVGISKKIIRSLGAATDPRQLGDAMGFDIEFPTGLDNCRRNRIVPAPRAQG